MGEQVDRQKDEKGRKNSHGELWARAALQSGPKPSRDGQAIMPPHQSIVAYELPRKECDFPAGA